MLLYVILAVFCMPLCAMEDIHQKQYDNILTTHIRDLKSKAEAGNILSALTLHYLVALAQDNYHEAVPYAISKELRSRQLASYTTGCKLDYCCVGLNMFRCCSIGCYKKINLKPEIAQAVKRQGNYDTASVLRSALKTKRDDLEKEAQIYTGAFVLLTVLDTNGTIPSSWIRTDSGEGWFDKSRMKAKLEQAWRTRGDQ